MLLRIGHSGKDNDNGDADVAAAQEEMSDPRRYSGLALECHALRAKIDARCPAGERPSIGLPRSICAEVAIAPPVALNPRGSGQCEPEEVFNLSECQHQPIRESIAQVYVKQPVFTGISSASLPGIGRGAHIVPPCKARGLAVVNQGWFARCSASHCSLIEPRYEGCPNPGSRTRTTRRAAVAVMSAPTMMSSMWFSPRSGRPIGS